MSGLSRESPLASSSQANQLETSPPDIAASSFCCQIFEKFG